MEISHGNLGNMKNQNIQNDFKNRKRITWLVSVLVDKNIDKDEYMNKLKVNGIEARPFFYPLSGMGIYKPYCNLGTPISKTLSQRGLNLPTYESLKSMKEIKKALLNVSK